MRQRVVGGEHDVEAAGHRGRERAQIREVQGQRAPAPIRLDAGRARAPQR
jgi:hypothetical protein